MYNHVSTFLSSFTGFVVNLTSDYLHFVISETATRRQRNLSTITKLANCEQSLEVEVEQFQRYTANKREKGLISLIHEKVILNQYKITNRKMDSLPKRKQMVIIKNHLILKWTYIFIKFGNKF